MRRDREQSFFYNIDWITVAMFLLLLLMGWGNIYAAVYNEDHTSIFDLTQRYGKQMIFIGCALVIAVAIIIIDASFYTATAYAIFGVTLFLNIAVIFIGKDVKGSHSWFKFGEFGIQPAEFAKFGLALALSKLLSDFGIKRKEFSNIMKAFGFILLPALIIVLQKETGGALVMFVFLIIFYREGMLPGWLFLAGFSPAIIFILGLKYSFVLVFCIIAAVIVAGLMLMRRTLRNVLLISLAGLFVLGLGYFSPKIVDKLPDHQQWRIKVWLGLKLIDKKHPLTDTLAQQHFSDSVENKYNYNVKQAMIAIGSGGTSGKGYLEGTQTKYNFVPEQETDFIFCTVGEEWGFLGTAGLILFYVVFIVRLIIMAERQRSDFSRIYGYGVAAVFFFHLLINVGMTIGLVPVIGIPLPFFSYGGSSLWGFTILLFIFIRLDSERLYILR